MKRILLFSLLSIAAASLSAQAPTLTLANMPKANTQHNFQNIAETALDSVNLGASGTNQTWDFSQLSLVPGGYSQIYLAASATPFITDFPAATIASTDEVTDSSSYTYYKGTNSEFSVMGSSDGTNELTYTPASKFFNLPFTYNTEFSQNTTLAGMAEGFTLAGTYKTSVKADGWGSVKTQLGIFPALRVQRITELNATVLFFSLVERDTATEYWTTSFEAPVFAYHRGLSEIFGETEAYEFAEALTGTTVDTKEPVLSSIDLQIAPNPVTDRSNLRFDLEKGGKAAVFVSDAQGRQVLTQQLGTLNAGNTQTELDFNALPAGTYFVALQVNGHFKGVNKVVKN
ncbi:MAG: T9SS type A sorting domain-containing protein [Chitinophagales bacterium]|nr:T9SS type A sorting domain-containing protein [Chitinophagales bacterium]